ncbi:zinc finger protein 14-like isoform X2 [Dreissena polymorpha]|uniref:zinc finger protein 14-like isoform X2 n=1 Tax=Dreissena polymorpha TaxID=45954 RepID=UPI002263E737|nr:zinc finger protein 14-like isoform X2 [Dreissena polymorpha]
MFGIRKEHTNVVMAPKPTPHELLARVADLFQTFETSDVHAFVMFIDTSSMTDVKSSGTNLGAKFVQSNPDIGKAFETFCTNWNTLKEDDDISSQRSDADNLFGGSLLSDSVLEVKSEIEEENPYDCDTDVETDIDESVDEMGDMTLIIKKETATGSNMPKQGEDSDDAGTSKKGMKTRCVKKKKEKLFANTKDRYGVSKMLSHLRKSAMRLPSKVNCHLCTKSFTTKFSLTRHVKLWHASWSCDKCKEDFGSRRAFVCHMKTAHANELDELGLTKAKPNPLFNCEICNMVFLTKFSVSRHKLVKHNPKVFECEICHEKFASDKLLREHNEDVHLKVWSSCKECGQTFSNKTEFRFHKKEHRVEKVIDNPFNKCLICEKEYSSAKELRRHTSRVHSSAKYPCHRCGKCFGLVADLKVHEKSHTNEFKCQYCSKVLKSAKILRDHENGHTKETVFVCDICGIEFYNNTSLAHHRKRHIFGSASFKKPKSRCQYCSAIFESSYYLSKHLRDHHLERALEDKSAYIKMCEFCNKVFISEKFQKHLDMHTQTKRHQCGVCSKAFVDKSNLFTHCVKVHKMKKHPCPVCKRIFWGPDQLSFHTAIEHKQE